MQEVQVRTNQGPQQQQQAVAHVRHRHAASSSGGSSSSPGRRHMASFSAHLLHRQQRHLLQDGHSVAEVLVDQLLLLRAVVCQQGILQLVHGGKLPCLQHQLRVLVACTRAFKQSASAVHSELLVALARAPAVTDEGALISLWWHRRTGLGHLIAGVGMQHCNPCACSRDTVPYRRCPRSCAPGLLLDGTVLMIRCSSGSSLSTCSSTRQFSSKDSWWLA
jgi:hypothetical protein